MTVLLSVGGNPYYQSSGPADELLFGSVDGMVRLRRAGDRWTAADRSLNGLHVSSLLREPDGGSLFAGTHNGHFEGRPLALAPADGRRVNAG